MSIMTALLLLILIHACEPLRIFHRFISQTNKIIPLAIITYFLQNEMIPYAYARNIPEYTGASGNARGKTSSLIPILRMQAIVEAALESSTSLDCTQKLSLIPSSERDFKRLFDEHSNDISYKQRFLDQNAFLVYYTQGFDGPGRDKIDKDDPESLKEKMQFGARNDAWVAVDEARAEAVYLQETHDNDITDLKKYLKAAVKAFHDYTSLDTPGDVEVARKLVPLVT